MRLAVCRRAGAAGNFSLRPIADVRGDGIRPGGGGPGHNCGYPADDGCGHNAGGYGGDSGGNCRNAGGYGSGDSGGNCRDAGGYCCGDSGCNCRDAGGGDHGADSGAIAEGRCAKR